LLTTVADESPSRDFSAHGAHPILLANQTLLDTFDILSQWEDISTYQHITINEHTLQHFSPQSNHQERKTPNESRASPLQAGCDHSIQEFPLLIVQTIKNQKHISLPNYVVITDFMAHSSWLNESVATLLSPYRSEKGMVTALALSAS
jgi:hypothetical protein